MTTLFILFTASPYAVVVVVFGRDFFLSPILGIFGRSLTGEQFLTLCGVFVLESGGGFFERVD
jgi:hypothetical protein